MSKQASNLIFQAAQILKSGGLVAFPTETVYGLGADAANEYAVSRIYRAKGRPSNHPLIVHISSASKMLNWSNNIPDYAHELANQYWPGPMTLILPRTNLAKNYVTGGQDSVGIRVPNHNIALKLLSSFESLGGLGVAAPSANRFGAVSPTTSECVKLELREHLSKTDLILDGGQCTIGLESTIIDCTTSTPSILRPGAITYEMISEITKVSDGPNVKLNELRTSGIFKSHYAPKAKVILNSIPSEGEGLIALFNIPTPKGVIRLMSPKNIEEFAKDLYIALRSGDRQNISKIVILIPEGTGLNEAIKDRLIKAAGLA
jgi:L-threonylcarbamoyladenylate synthase